MIDAVDAAEGDGFETAITGEFTADEDFTTLSRRIFRRESSSSAPRGAGRAASRFRRGRRRPRTGAPALVAIVVALALTALVGQAFDLSVFVVNMLTGMGLALGIDYALFVVSPLPGGAAPSGPRSSTRSPSSGATASRAVLFSGTAFVLAMVGMVLVPDTILRSLATGAILVGIVSVVAALTLLPAVLALLGDRVERPAVPWLGRRDRGERRRRGAVWSLDRPSCHARAAAQLLGVDRGTLVALAVPILGFETGFSGVRTLPDRFPSKHGFTRARGVVRRRNRRLRAGRRRGRRARRPELQRARSTASPRGSARIRRFRSPQVDVAADGQAAEVEALVVGDSRDEPALCGRRSGCATTSSRKLLAGAGRSRAGHGRDGGDDRLPRADLDRWLPDRLRLRARTQLRAAHGRVPLGRAAAVAIGSTCSRSAPRTDCWCSSSWKASATTCSASPQVEVIAAWLPLFLFSVLFGLSMDYTVFLLSRIRSATQQGSPTARGRGACASPRPRGSSPARR